jgi:asparagine synthase (glutamine-hydrolysing)
VAQPLRWAAAAARPLVELLPSSSAKASSLDWQAKRFVRGAGLSTLERHYEWKTMFSDDERRELLEPERRSPTNMRALLRDRYDGTERADELARVMDLDLAIFLVDDMLVKTDRSSMANSLEARVPILDPVVAELALALPRRMKVRGFQKKRLLRQAVAPLLPDAVLRGEKRGFSVPMAAWLRGDLHPLARDLLSADNLRRTGFFRPESVTRLLDDHVAGRADNSRKVWALLVFALWFDRYGAVAPDIPEVAAAAR